MSNKRRIINIEDVFENQKQRAFFNAGDLENIDFYKDGKKVDVSTKEIDYWKCTGLNYTDFVIMRKW